MFVRAVALIGLLTTGCGSFAMLGGSNTVPAHDFELAALVGVSGKPAPSLGPPVTLAVQARYGLTDAIDVGVRIFTTGASIEGRLQIYRPPQDDSVAISALLAGTVGTRLASSLSCSGTGCSASIDTAVLEGHLRSVVGMRFGWAELVVALDVGAHTGLGAWLWGGGDVAFIAHLPRGWSVGAEGSYLLPVNLINVHVASEHFASAPEGLIGLTVFKTF